MFVNQENLPEIVVITIVMTVVIVYAGPHGLTYRRKRNACKVRNNSYCSR